MPQRRNYLCGAVIAFPAVYAENSRNPIFIASWVFQYSFFAEIMLQLINGFGFHICAANGAFTELHPLCSTCGWGLDSPKAA